MAVRWQKAEGLMMLAAALVFYAYSGNSWWWFALLFLVPDLAMLAYLSGPRLGALAYNAAHALIGPALLAALSLWVDHPVLQALATIWVAHIGFDRMLGYGLKSPEGFHFTHLGLIGQKKRPDR